MKKIITGLFWIFSHLIQAQNPDVELLKALNPDQPSRFGDPFFKTVSASSYPVSIAAPVTVFAAGLWKKDKLLRRRSYQMVAGIGLSMSMSLLIKYAVDRPRPAVVYPSVFQKTEEHSPSFPSGHTTAAFETATSLSLNFPKWYVIIPSYAWAGTMAYSRMYLGIHYPSDVAAGILLGTGCAWLTWQINKKIYQKRDKSRLVPKE